MDQIYKPKSKNINLNKLDNTNNNINDNKNMTENENINDNNNDYNNNIDNNNDNVNPLLKRHVKGSFKITRKKSIGKQEKKCCESNQKVSKK